MTSLNLREVTEFAPGYLLVPTGGKIIYVHSSGAGALSELPPGMVSSADGFVTSVQLALSTCRSGRGDKIICLPGHTETIGAADAWSNLGSKTDVEVYCVPAGESTATFTWTVAGSTLLMDAASFRIRNARMFLAGEHATGAALTVAAPITVSAAGCELTGCRMWAGFEADRAVTIGVTTTAAANRFVFDSNVVRGDAVAGATLTTTFLRVVGGSDLRITNNDIACGTSAAAVGPVQNLTTESLDVLIENNVIKNNAASSTACITWALASSTGTIRNNDLRNMLDGSFAHIVVTSGDMQLFRNNGVNNSNESNRVLFLGTASA